MKKSILFVWIICVFNSLSVFSQENIEISGTIKDVNNNQIPNAHIQDISKNYHTTSDENGFYKLQIPFDTCTLIVSHVGFHNESIQIKDSDLKKIINLDIVLAPREYILDEISVSDIRKVYDVENVYIADYEIVDDYIFFLMFQGSKDFLKVVDVTGKELSSLQLDMGTPKQLFKDCLNEIHVITWDSIFQVAFKDDLFIIYRSGLREFNATLERCVLFKNRKLYFKENGMYNQYLQYTTFDTRNQKQEIFHTILDTINLMTALSANNEIKNFKRKGLNRMGEITIPDLEALRDNKENEFYLRDIIAMPDYNPLLFIKDSIYVFDHVNHEICVFDSSGNYFRKVNILYDQQSSWAKELIVSEDQLDVYVKFERNGNTSLQKVNLNNGTLTRRIGLEKNTYPTKIKVKGDYLYYLYRDIYDTKNSKHLYKQIIY